MEAFANPPGCYHAGLIVNDPSARFCKFTGEISIILHGVSSSSFNLINICDQLRIPFDIVSNLNNLQLHGKVEIFPASFNSWAWSLDFNSSWSHFISSCLIFHLNRCDVQCHASHKWLGCLVFPQFLHPRCHSHVQVSCDVMWCDVMWCDVMWCDVMWCDVMWCDVMWCNVMWCDVAWCVNDSWPNNQSNISLTLHPLRLIKPRESVYYTSFLIGM